MAEVFALAQPVRRPGPPRGGGAEIAEVAPGGIAAAVGIEPGDLLAGIDGHPVQDILDYQFRTFPDRIRLRVVKRDGEEWDVAIDKDPGEPLGLALVGEVYDGVRECANHCFFCFVNQLPPGLRSPLYVKDDDMRLSVLCGNFVTLTNLTHADLARIREQRLSPLRVSIHSTDPELRRRMLGNPAAAPILPLLAELGGIGIELHGQIVLCPGVNDGPALDATLGDLMRLQRPLRSTAVVPVGVTRFARGGLRPYGADEAETILGVTEGWQRRYRAAGAGDLQTADELYLVAGREPPPVGEYGEFPQLNNGVGMVRWFTHRWRLATRTLPRSVPARRVLVLTGTLFAPWLGRQMVRLSGIEGLTVEVLGCANGLFGPTVTVGGLLGGEDLCRCAGAAGGTWDQILVPPHVLRAEGDLTLDGWSLADLAGRLGAPVAAPPMPGDLVRSILGRAQRRAVS